MLEAQCALAEAGVIQEQYDSIEDLVRDGNNLGFVLDEQGQGAEHWRERFDAALEYEECDRLRLALDISQNLNCYELDMYISKNSVMLSETTWGNPYPPSLL